MVRHLFLKVLALVLPWAGLVAQNPRPLHVVAMHTVLAEIACRVGGDRVVVAGLVQAGVDPHTFEPSAQDMRAVADADLVLVSGLHLESYLDRLVSQQGGSSRVLVVGDALPTVLRAHSAKSLSVPPDRTPAPATEPDPHWWHSINNVIFAVNLVRDRFIRARPFDRDTFTRNASRYVAQLVSLQHWAAEMIATLPPERRRLVTSHDAFAYFCHDYSFVVSAISGLSTDSETNAADLARLVDTIRSERIKAIFPENTVNPRLVESLVAETKVTLGGVLYADGLGVQGTDATTYESMYRHNVRTIVDALH